MDTTDLKARMNTKVQALAEREPDTSQYLALTGNALELIRENLKHQPLSFQLFESFFCSCRHFFSTIREKNVPGTPVAVQTFSLDHPFFFHAVEDCCKRSRFDVTGCGDFFLGRPVFFT